MPTKIDLEDPSVFETVERRMMSKEDELIFRLKHGKAPKTVLHKEAKIDYSRPEGERTYLNYYITNLEQDEK